MSGAGAMLRRHLSTMPIPPPRSPLSRSAGEGPGVRAARSAGEGPGVRAALTSPPGSPFLHGAKACWPPSHNGHTSTGHAQREIWVFDQALSCFG